MKKKKNNFLKNNINNKEEEIYLLTGQINSNMYFDFLHSLFFSLHKNVKKKRKKNIKIRDKIIESDLLLLFLKLRII
jgi:hypothetical protein